MSRRSPSQGKSQHLRDPVKAILMNYGERIESTSGGEKLYLEARDLQGFFNPYNKFMQDALHVEHSNPEVVKVLEAHFLDRGHLWGVGLEMNFVHKLMHFIGYMHENNAFFGKSYSEVVWDNVELANDKTWTLPIELNLLPNETMRKKWNGTFIQRYSFLTRMKIFGQYYTYKTVHFKRDEIFTLEWPFGINLVWTRIRYIYKNKFKFLIHGVEQSEAAASPNTKSFRLLRATRRSRTSEKLNYQITELKIRRVMRIGAYTDNFSPTQFYDAYLLYRYLLDKAYALNIYIDEFNKQVMANLARKNDWDEVPLLTYKGKYQEKLIADTWNKYLKKDISYKDFIDQVSEKDQQV